MDGAIFPFEINPTDIKLMAETVHKKLRDCDNLDLYVTGLSVCLVEVIGYCYHNFVPLTLWHFNRDTNEYYSQKLYTCEYYQMLHEGGYK